MKVILTGSTGFVGSAVLAQLIAKHHDVVTVIRRAGGATTGHTQSYIVPNFAADSAFRTALTGREVVIHCAARAHVMQETTSDPLVEFRAVNVDATLALARQAIAAGVRRFVYISSIKVNGEGTEQGKPFKANDVPAPADPYGISKMEAEQGLMALAKESDMEVVIIRPVLVYGPGVKANFRSMMNWLNKGIPLPLGRIHNKRSLVALDNLVDLIVTCTQHTAAANQTFLVSDGEDLSTTELLTRMSKALDRPMRLLPVPAGLLQLGGKLLGKDAVMQRLCGSLQVDISHTRQTLGWVPPVSVDSALRKTADHFLATV
ncbi:UDP-glucose 4-epimerase family protein [Halopseudomonas sp.]|jgi:nucleoside-diphosphate-sugar epimerase|uniref:UDP-glucose 4-epimerase family protein n=1 Tax=Halopseudomonas sp. TaxID=2901191 RepID=UPI0039E515F0